MIGLLPIYMRHISARKIIVILNFIITLNKNYGSKDHISQALLYCTILLFVAAHTNQVSIATNSPKCLLGHSHVTVYVLSV